MRRGVTMVEALMAGLIATIILTALYQILIGGMSAFGRNSRSADAMLNALIALETLSNDLAQLNTTEKDAPAPFPGLRPLAGDPGPVTLDANRKDLSFRVTRAGKTAADELVLEDVSWGIAAVKSPPGVYQIRRNGAPLSDVLVKRLTFEFFPAEHPESLDVLYIRTTLVGTDPTGAEEFTLARLTSLPVPTGYMAKLKWRRLSRAGADAKAGAP